MARVTDLTNAEHYRWGAACDGWHLLKTDGLSVIRENMPPGTAEQRHYHRKAQQFFYILSGTADFTCGKDTHMLEAGQGIAVPAGEEHHIANLSGEDLSFLVISAPRAHGDRVNLP